MILAAYIDESGTHGGSSFTVMAGYYSDTERWSAFDAAWRAFLQCRGLTHLHTKDLFHGNGQHKGQDWQIRKDIAGEAYSIAKAHAVGFVAIMKNDDYRDVLQADEAMKRVAIDSKFGMCFRRVLSFLGQSANHENAEGIRIILESGHRNLGATKTLLEQYRHIGEPTYSELVKSITYTEKIESPGVQAADFLAFSSYNAIQNRKLLLDAEEIGPPNVWHLLITEKYISDIKSGLKLLAEMRNRYGKTWRSVVKRQARTGPGDFLLSPDPYVISKWFQGLPERRWSPAPSSSGPTRWPSPPPVLQPEKR